MIETNNYDINKTKHYLNCWLQHMPTVSGKLARSDSTFHLPYEFVTYPSNLI